MKEQQSRRNVLKAMGASAASLTLAGCQDILGEEKEENEDPTPARNTTSTPTEAPAENETATETPGEDDDSEKEEEVTEAELLEQNLRNREKIWEITPYNDSNFSTRIRDFETIMDVGDILGYDFTSGFPPRILGGVKKENLRFRSSSLTDPKGRLFVYQLEGADFEKIAASLDEESYRGRPIKENNSGWIFSSDLETQRVAVARNIEDIERAIDMLEGDFPNQTEKVAEGYEKETLRESTNYEEDIILDAVIGDELGYGIIGRNRVQEGIYGEDSDVESAMTAVVYDPKNEELVERLYRVHEDGEVEIDDIYGEVTLEPSDTIFFE